MTNYYLYFACIQSCQSLSNVPEVSKKEWGAGLLGLKCMPPPRSGKRSGPFRSTNWSQPPGLWLWRDRWDLGWELVLPLVTCDFGGSLNLNKTQPSSSIKHGHLLHGSLQTSNGSAPAQDWTLHGGGVATWTGTVWGTAVDFTCFECAFQGKTNCSALDKAGESITQIGTTSPRFSAHFPTGFFALSG